MTLAALNSMDLVAFVHAVGWVFEHSPWVAERAWPLRPFVDLESLHGVMTNQVESATDSERRALLRAHPDLGTRARVSDASAAEQTGAGLTQLSAEEFDRLTRMNEVYKNRFGFPFLYAVKGSVKQEILQALETRLNHSPEGEFAEALRQVYRIARFRLEELLD